MIGKVQFLKFPRDEPAARLPFVPLPSSESSRVALQLPGLAKKQQIPADSLQNLIRIRQNRAYNQ